MATNNSTVFTVLFRSVGHGQKCNPRRTKFGEVFYGVYKPGGAFELIPTLKMETTHPAEGSFGCEFPAICNHCWVMAAGSL